MSSKPSQPAPVGTDLDDRVTAAARSGVPATSASHVPRPRLVAALDDAASARLVLVSGPAGSGKTSLLAEWLHEGASHGDDLGWVTFEDEDTRLWQPLLACLAALGLPTQYAAAQPPPDLLLGRTRLEELAAAVAASGRRWTLVIDGYELRSTELAAEVTFLLDHTEGRLRLVFAARVDPVLPLYRFRLDDSLAEVRAADLRFTDAEAADLLRRCDVQLPAGLVHDLDARLGGWAAGLRFAARALTRHEHPVDSVVAVVAQTVDINEYLLAEVLQVQEPETRDLLLRTCVPDLLRPELAEELAGPDAPRALAELARSNMFLEPVPDRPGYYRYPPFFRDLLRAQLAFEDPATAAELHRRAAAWLRGRDMSFRSVTQLATGGLWPDVARQLVDDLLVPRLLLGQDERLLEMARHIPADLDDPAACIVRAALALAAADPLTCAEELDRARPAADPAASDDAPSGLSFAVVDSLRACAVDDLDSAAALVERTSRALAAARSRAAGLAGPTLEGLLEVAGAMVALRRGDLPQARAGFTRVGELPGMPVRFRAAVLGYLALTDALDGRLTHAWQQATEAMALADDGQVPSRLRNPAAATALALVSLERDDLAAARQHLTSARSCRALVVDPVSRTVTAGVSAHVEAASGEGRPALAHLESVCDRADLRDPWLAGWLRLQAAGLAVTLGLPDHALRALEDISAEDSASGQVVAAAAYAEQGRPVALERSLSLARATERPLPDEVTRLLVEGVHQSRRHSPRQAAPLVEQALQLAAREEARRPFREASPSVLRLLAGNPHLLDRHRWLSDADPGRTTPTRAPARPPASGALRAGRHEDPNDVSQLVVEPLTAKEHEVLGHLEELLTTEEIAEKMFVSVNTVRTHVRSILRKLGVNRRNSAVRRARELGLLDRPLN